MNAFEREKKKLQSLSGRQKLLYIWDYYRLWIIGGAALLLIAAYLISSAVHANRENRIYVMFVNTFGELGQDSSFWQGYVDFCGVDTGQENVVFDAQNYFDMSKQNVTGNHYFEKAVVLADSGTMDAIVMERDNLTHLGESGRLIDLRDDRTAFLAERYAERLITVSVADEDGVLRDIPVGIDISDSRLVTNRAYEDCALGIPAQAQHLQAVGEFLEYVLMEA